MLDFASEHEESERTHLILLNQIMDDRRFLVGDRSILLPVWRFAGFMLGFGSTIYCPRGMYLTTDAVESFVEEHYQSQIRRLRDEVSLSKRGREDLTALLELCCEDEVHHRDDARARADAAGTLPWRGFRWMDDAWRWVVFRMSYAGAAIAKCV